MSTTIYKCLNICIILNCVSFAPASKGFLWTKFKISEARLQSAAVQSGHNELSIDRNLSWNIACALSCLKVGWCNVICPDALSTPTSCHHFRLYVSPEYQETNMGDALDCYTRNFKNYAVGATIYGDAPQNAGRVKEHLIDGIYDFGDINRCYMSSDYHNGWVKLDLGSEKNIWRVMFVLQPNSYASNFYDVDILVGVEDLPESEFSRYVLFGRFPGPSSESLEVELTRDPPIRGRYVVVQRSTAASCEFTVTDQCIYQYCFLDIN